MESKSIKFFFYIIVLIFLLTSTRLNHAVQLQENGKVTIPDKTPGTIKIYGNLNETV
jgi:hypothetical protein